MNRTKGILAAGTLTGVILITVLVLGLGNLKAQTTDAQSATNMVLPPATAVTTDQPSAQDLQSLQAYNQQLEAALQIMQEREAVYQAQIEQANQTVLQLQDQLNTQIQSQSAVTIGRPAVSSFSEHEEHEGFEHDDD